ncbi:apolipoprotein N-acyltransferase [Myxococcus sp. CA039A]|uniref:apolipoprotein N-acyltransferase n=1 Tax=Myxococcus sp. CA039A TaxID=2741737 RepID=UPI00157B3D4E|nr:apolipoprotein N-acyltransferase [Myxococcus sp. CA039A]NTX52256.1 apolipoprotein N-acyltransferase [Myxococcus sp. CA039A]
MLGREEASSGRRFSGGLGAVLATTLALWVFSLLRMPWTLLGWVALVPWLVVVDRARSSREALLLGAGLSVTFSAAVLGWFPGALQSYSGAPLWLCWLLMLLLAPVFQLQFPVTALARQLARRAVGNRAGWLPPMVSVLVYVGVEWLAPKPFADTLGQGFVYSERLRQFADVAGAPGLTLALLFVNECVFAMGRAFRTRGAPGALKPLVAAVALVVVMLGYGSFRLAQYVVERSTQTALVVGAVQANIINYEKLKAEHGTYEVVRMILDTHYALSDSLLREAPLDVLIWPETVYPTPFGVPKSEAGAELDAEISAYVAARNVPLIFGSYDVEGGKEFNAAMFLSPGDKEGEAPTRKVYRKSKLFPLTEWVPELIDSPGLREWLPWTGRWSPGAGPRTVLLKRRDGRILRVAPLICYDTLFPSYVADEATATADLLLTLSNDSWFGGTPGPRLHLTHAVFRSIETRRPQVRVTNSGVSALIDDTGEILTEIGDGQRGTAVMRVPWHTAGYFLARRWGNWLGPVALVMAVALLGGAVLGGRGERY